MGTKVDPSRYPYLARYIAGLPEGLWSYPECLVRTEVHEPVRQDFPQLAELEDLPLRLTEFLSGEYQADWMGEVIGGALSMLVRDVIFNDDATLYRWRYDEMTKLFKKPVYRVLMFLMSPGAILKSATRKWSAFHMGSKLTPGEGTTQGNRITSASTLDFPAGLFNQTYATLVATTYQAGLDCSRARDAKVVVTGLSATQSVFEASWEA